MNVASVNVLVVDDDQGIRQVVEAILEDEGYRVVTATNGQEGLTRVLEKRPDIVLLDLNMPIMDGWQFQVRLREVDPGLPVVFMTAGQRAQVEAEKHKAAGYLVKPFNLEDLLATVERLVPRRGG